MTTFNSSDNQIISDLDSLFNASPQVLNFSSFSLNQSFTITIQLTDDTTHIIELNGADEVEKTAKEFCLKFGLDEKYEEMIVEAIEKHLEGKGRTIKGKEEKRFFSSLTNSNGSYNYHTVLINNKIDTISLEEPINPNNSNDAKLILKGQNKEKPPKTNVLRLPKRTAKPEVSNQLKRNHSFHIEQSKISKNNSSINLEQIKKCSALDDYKKMNRMPTNDLYQRSKSFYQSKKEKINQIKQNLKEEEERSLIFTPQIDQISILLEKNREEGSTFKRLYELHSARKEKLKGEKERIEKEEINSCSFRPKINETSRIIDHLKNSSNSIDRFEQLHKNSENQKKKNENKENFSFKPKINPILKTPEKFLERQENFLMKKDERCKSAIKERMSFIESNFFYPKINPSKSSRKQVKEFSPPENENGNPSDMNEKKENSQVFCFNINQNIKDHSNLIGFDNNNKFLKDNNDFFDYNNTKKDKISNRNEIQLKMNNNDKTQKRRPADKVEDPFFLLFKILDFRGLNYICEGNLAIEKLGEEIRAMLNPIFDEIIKLKQRIDFEDFEHAIEKLLKNVKEHDQSKIKGFKVGETSMQLHKNKIKDIDELILKMKEKEDGLSNYDKLFKKIKRIKNSMV